MNSPDRSIQTAAFDRHVESARYVAKTLSHAPLGTFLDDPTAFERAQALVDWHTRAAIIIAINADIAPNNK